MSRPLAPFRETVRRKHPAPLPPRPILRLTEPPPVPLGSQDFCATVGAERYYIRVTGYPPDTDPATIGAPDEIVEFCGILLRAVQLGRHVQAPSGAWLPAARSSHGW